MCELNCEVAVFSRGSGVAGEERALGEKRLCAVPEKVVEDQFVDLEMDCWRLHC